MTGEDKMDATAIIDYFAPLKTWLDEQNKKTVGETEGQSQVSEGQRSEGRILATLVVTAISDF